MASEFKEKVIYNEYSVSLIKKQILVIKSMNHKK
jgi:hypothetical protein